MLIGIDFDNTIAGYDHVFVSAAAREGLLPEAEPLTKKQLRDALRRQPDGERTWMQLQGRVYGALMHEAELIDGVADFLGHCRKTGTDVCIVSHKTEFGHFDKQHINLREAALSWMTVQGFFSADGFGLSRDAVFFESTRPDKVARIGQLQCTHFIDDLEEVFREPTFPKTTRPYLFAPGGGPEDAPFGCFDTWQGIADDILGGTAS